MFINEYLEDGHASLATQEVPSQARGETEGAEKTEQDVQGKDASPEEKIALLKDHLTANTLRQEDGEAFIKDTEARISSVRTELTLETPQDTPPSIVRKRGEIETLKKRAAACGCEEVPPRKFGNPRTQRAEQSSYDGKAAEPHR